MNRIALGTRKGLLILAEQNGKWEVQHEAHLGARVSYAMLDTRNCVMYACLDHGHWGSKLQRSADGGKEWEEISTPKYPSGAELVTFIDDTTMASGCQAMAVNHAVHVLEQLTQAEENLLGDADFSYVMKNSA